MMTPGLSPQKKSEAWQMKRVNKVIPWPKKARVKPQNRTSIGDYNCWNC